MPIHCRNPHYLLVYHAIELHIYIFHDSMRKVKVSLNELSASLTFIRVFFFLVGVKSRLI